MAKCKAVLMIIGDYVEDYEVRRGQWPTLSHFRSMRLWVLPE